MASVEVRRGDASEINGNDRTVADHELVGLMIRNMPGLGASRTS
jgi:hypothetical protein